MIAVSAWTRQADAGQVDSLLAFLDGLTRAIWSRHLGAIEDALLERTRATGGMDFDHEHDWDGDQALLVLTFLEDLQSHARRVHPELGERRPQPPDPRQLPLPFADDLRFCLNLI